MNWRNMTVLVTGAGGFIGSHLAERLVALGASTRALVRYNSAGTAGWLDSSAMRTDMDVVFGDVRDPDCVQSAVRGVNVVFHLAALIGIPYSYHAPRSYVATNIEGTLNVLQAALAARVDRVVETSTSEVYGSARYVPINEDHPLQGQSPYSASKIAADKLAEAFHLSFGLSVVTARPFNTYGPRQSARAVIPTIIAQALTQPAVQLGYLESTRDFNYVADTVEGFVRIAESPGAAGQVVNIGSGIEVTIDDLARTILGILGVELPIVSNDDRRRPEASEVARLCADNDKARRLLGWEPRFTLREGLVQTIDWVKHHLDRYRPEHYSI